MIVVFGDDQDSAKLSFLELRSKKAALDGEVEWHQARSLEVAKLRELLMETDLFGNRKQVFLESLADAYKGKKKDEVRELLSMDEFGNLVVLENRYDSRFYQGMRVVKLEKKLPAVIFGYLDSLGCDGVVVLERYLKVLETEPAEKIFRMTVLRLCDLLRVRSGKGVGRAGYYWKKIELQARKLQTEELVRMYYDMYKIEREMKTGQTPVELASRLELYWQLYRL